MNYSPKALIGSSRTVFARKGSEILERGAEIKLVAVLLHIPKMRGADGIRKSQERFGRASHGLFFIDVDGGETRPSRRERRRKCSGHDELRPAGIDEHRIRLHEAKIRCLDQSARLGRQPDMQRHHVAR